MLRVRSRVLLRSNSTFTPAGSRQGLSRRRAPDIALAVRGHWERRFVGSDTKVSRRLSNCSAVPDQTPFSINLKIGVASRLASKATAFAWWRLEMNAFRKAPCSH